MRFGNPLGQEAASFSSSVAPSAFITSHVSRVISEIRSAFSA